VHHRSQRDRRKHDRAYELRADDYRPAPRAVQPDAGREADEQPGGELRGGEDAHLRRRGPERHRRRDGKCEQGELRAEQRDRLACPELEELRVAQQTRPILSHRPGLEMVAGWAARTRSFPSLMWWMTIR